MNEVQTDVTMGTEETLIKPIVIYHNNCTDGWAAAMAAKIHHYWKDATYIASDYSSPPPDVTGAQVLILDFSYSREILEAMRSKSKSLFLIDHHEIAAKELSDLRYCHFDISHSGAYLAWSILHGYVPKLIEYVEDYDLWKFKLPDSHEINATIKSYPYSESDWNKLLKCDALDLVIEGRSILRARDQMVDNMVAQWVRNPKYAIVGGYLVPIVNCTILWSQVVGKLAELSYFAVGYQDIGDMRKYDLRSMPTLANVGEIAKYYGGGGHHNSAGFVIPADNGLITTTCSPLLSFPLRSLNLKLNFNEEVQTNTKITIPNGSHVIAFDLRNGLSQTIRYKFAVSVDYLVSYELNKGIDLLKDYKWLKEHRELIFDISFILTVSDLTSDPTADYTYCKICSELPLDNGNTISASVCDIILN